MTNILDLLLDVRFVDPNVQNEFGFTPLISASHRGHHEIVDLLLQMEDIDINLQTEKGETALSLAAIHGNEGSKKNKF